MVTIIITTTHGHTNTNKQSQYKDSLILHAYYTQTTCMGLCTHYYAYNSLLSAYVRSLKLLLTVITSG